MNTHRTAICFALLLTAFLGGCTKATDPSAKTETAAAPAVPEQPVVPDAVQAGAAASQPGAAPVANAGTDVVVSGTEARAGDVSVKLPD